MDTHRVQLWARMDPFLIGVLQFPPPAKFNLHYLRKMATYVRTRSVDGCFPRLYWTMWRHIACGKLQLQEDMAWLYFEVFHSLSERTALKSLEWAEAASSCKSVEEYERVRSKVTTACTALLWRSNSYPAVRNIVYLGSTDDAAAGAYNTSVAKPSFFFFHARFAPILLRCNLHQC